jgi:hypothetical protein
VLTDPTLSKEDALLSWLTLPEADFAQVAFEDVVLRRWSEQLSAGIETLQDRPAFIALFLDRMDQVIRRMDASDYPQRAERLTELLLEVLQPSAATFSGHSQEIWYRWQQRGTVSIMPLVLTEEESSVAHSSAGAPQVQQQTAIAADPALAAQIEAQAKELLSDAGALFTVQTSIAHVQGASVQVRGIVFSMPARDRLFDFVLDTEKREVRAIMEGATEYPYALSLAQFVSWVHR